jgi:transcriptional regulator with XRE-family HTH domain
VAAYGRDDKREQLLEMMQVLKKHGFNQADVAKEIGVSRSTMTRYLREINKNSPGLKHYEAMIGKITNATKFKAILAPKMEEEQGGYERLKGEINKRLDQVMLELKAIRESNHRIEKAMKIDPNGGESSKEDIP